MSWSSFWQGVGNLLTGNVPSKYNETHTGLVGNLLGSLGIKTDAHYNADLARSEYSAQQAFERDKQLMEMNNQFNAEQVQIGREWQAQREDTYYQRKVEDMKTAGINPIMAISGGGADVGSTPTASSSSVRSSGSNYSGSSAGNGLGAIASVLAGLITKGKSSGTTLSQTFNKHGELVRSTINSRR